MAGGFKQACPSCEAKVSVLEDEIGKKKECPECKFRFKVEAPSKDKPAEKKDRKSTRLNSSHIPLSRMPSSA